MQPDQPLDHLVDHAATLSDRDLVSQVFRVLTSPPVAEADSFVLHAPLELMARAELLPSVDPARREQARLRIVDIATQWSSRTPHEPVPVATATDALPDAVAAGDLEAADRALVELAARHDVDGFVTVAAEALLHHLGGAGHLAIFLDHLTRQHRPGPDAITSGRALIRDLAQHPDWTIRWIDAPLATTSGQAASFFDVLADPPSAGDPGSSSIDPTMHLVDDTGMAAELLTGPARSLPFDTARRQLLRIAAMSMLQDDPGHAPYGWSHCLTMPQAVLDIAHRTADTQRAVEIAATYVLGFRATQSSTALDLRWRPERVDPSGRLLAAEADEAVARAWHTDDPHTIERELATYAATHPDAHLAKYTLACFHAAHADPDAAPVFRAAATRLAIWWRDHDADSTAEVRGRTCKRA